MQKTEIYYVTPITYNALYDYCAKVLLIAQAEVNQEPYAIEKHFKGAAFFDEADAYSRVIDRLNYEYVPTDAFKAMVDCPAEDKQEAINNLFRQITVGRGRNLSPKYQYVSQETYNRILAKISETLFYDFTLRKSKKLIHPYLDESSEFYEWFSNRYDSKVDGIRDAIVNDGAIPGLVDDLGNRAEDFDELIIEILNTYRVKPD